MGRKSKEALRLESEELATLLVELGEKREGLLKEEKPTKKEEQEQKRIEQDIKVKVERLNKLNEMLKEKENIEKPIPKKRKSKKLIFATKGLIEHLFNNIISKRMGEHWNLSPEEIDGFSGACDSVLLKHNLFFEKWGEEINLGFWCFMIFAPRLQHDRETKKAIKDNVKSTK